MSRPGGGRDPAQIYYERPGTSSIRTPACDVKPGCQRLHGDQALAYVRTRHLSATAVPDFYRISAPAAVPARGHQSAAAADASSLKLPALITPVLAKPPPRRRPEDRRPRVPRRSAAWDQHRRGGVPIRPRHRTARQSGRASGRSCRWIPSAEQIFAAIRDGKPHRRTVGRRPVYTPPSAANITVAVVDQRPAARRRERRTRPVGRPGSTSRRASRGHRGLRRRR